MAEAPRPQRLAPRSAWLSRLRSNQPARAFEPSKSILSKSSALSPLLPRGLLCLTLAQQPQPTISPHTRPTLRPQDPKTPWDPSSPTELRAGAAPLPSRIRIGPRLREARTLTFVLAARPIPHTIRGSFERSAAPRQTPSQQRLKPNLPRWLTLRGAPLSSRGSESSHQPRAPEHIRLKHPHLPQTPRDSERTQAPSRLAPNSTASKDALPSVHNTADFTSAVDHPKTTGHRRSTNGSYGWTLAPRNQPTPRGAHAVCSSPVGPPHP